MYQSSHFHKATPLALSLISDTILNPSFLPEELESQKDAARYEIREITAKPDMILPEVLHHVAYGGTGLGSPLLCPEHRISAIDDLTLRSSMAEWYRPERMVIAGAGMRHEELVELTDKYFSSLKYSPLPAPPPQVRPNPSQQLPSHLLSSPSLSASKSLTRAASYLFPTSPATASDSLSALTPSGSPSTYTGGHRFIHEPSTEFNHLYIAFEGVGIHDSDIYALATMQVLLGGGGSFSAGEISAPSYSPPSDFL
jgi:processing peptidase subunit alpha